MHFIYVDESGDPGKYDLTVPENLRASRHFIVSGVIVPAAEWRNYLTAIVDVRRRLKNQYGLPVRSELHGTELINPRGNSDFKKVGTRKIRIDLYKAALQNFAARLPQVKIINIHLDKLNPRSATALARMDADELVWERLLQRFQTYLVRSCNNSLGVVFADQTNEVKMRRLLRKMRVFNQVSSNFGGFYAAPLTNIVEDPIMRSSENSYFIQVADLTAHALYRLQYPKGSFKRYNVDKMFDLLDPLLLKVAARNDSRGIVHV